MSDMFESVFRAVFRPFLRMTGKVMEASWRPEDAAEINRWLLTTERIRQVDQALEAYRASGDSFRASSRGR